jgi:hypothetical protein
MPRADGPFKVIKNINENAYKLDLPADFGDDTKDEDCGVSCDL